MVKKKSGTQVVEALAPEALVTALEKAYKVKLPAAYVQFLTSGLHAKHATIELTGYLQATWTISFVDRDLPDLETLSTKSGVLDFSADDWKEHFKGYTPIAYLYDPDDTGDPEEDQSGSKMFLVLHVADEKHAVYYLDYEGHDLWHVASSLDEFVAGLGKAFEIDVNRRYAPMFGEKSIAHHQELEAEKKRKLEAQLGALKAEPYKGRWEEAKQLEKDGRFADAAAILEALHKELPDNQMVKSRFLMTRHRANKDAD